MGAVQPEESPARATVLSWLRERGRPIQRIEALAGDVSVRRYSRVLYRDGGSDIAVLYPETAREACERYRRTTAWLEGIAVRVPRILQADCERGLMLLEDVGEQTLYERAPERREALAAYFREARRLAERIATLPADSVAALNPPLDASLLRTELTKTWDAFAERRTPGGLASEVQELFDALAAGIAADPPCPCHRDFMVRNLVPVAPAPALAVLDHQDLRLGPPLYDLASLLNDSLFPERPLESRILVEAGVDDAASRQRYHRTAAQRTLKALGTYATAAELGQRQHLPLLAPTLERALAHLAAIPEGSALVPRLRASWDVAS